MAFKLRKNMSETEKAELDARLKELNTYRHSYNVGDIIVDKHGNEHKVLERNGEYGSATTLYFIDTYHSYIPAYEMDKVIEFN